MIAALIQGDLVSDPVERTTTKGAPFVTATVRVAAGAEALFSGNAGGDRVDRKGRRGAQGLAPDCI